MKALAVVRACKLIALFGFVLPWLLVSCSGQPIFSASGFDLAIGSITVHNPLTGAAERHAGPADLWLDAAIAVIVGGLFATFGIDRSRAARLALCAACVAFGLCAFGMNDAHDLPRARQNADRWGLAQVALGLISVQVRFGYYVTMVGLAAAGGFSLAELTAAGRPADTASRPRPAAPPPVAPTPAAPTPAASAPPTARRWCTACGVEARATGRFCEACGQRLVGG